jgi:hypothetical protein
MKTAWRRLLLELLVDAACRLGRGDHAARPERRAAGVPTKLMDRSDLEL